MTSYRFPVGIKNRNPGNLREWRGPNGPRPQAGGFAVFDNFDDGVHAYLTNLWSFYNAHRLKTLNYYITRYAPPSENDTMLYINRMCSLVPLNPLTVASRDLRLDLPWNAVKFALAQFRIEQGDAPPDWLGYPEWVTLSLLQRTMRSFEQWKSAV